MSAIVVHVTQTYDVYIGRGRDPKSHHTGTRGNGMWGNPFVVGRDGTRDDVIRLYREWLRAMRPDLVARAKRELAGKRLGCYCAPLPCHGDVLAAIANGESW